LDKFKAVVLARTTCADEARLRHLLSATELGDRSPPLLLKHLRYLVGDNKVDDSVLRQLWAKCFPTNTNAIILLQTSDTPL
uniref:CARD domain-containing protein n=1 Tax=Mesocestoides corti TaxID=53468 RepID=A0A5K3G067_MESCO